jgi:RNA polymerase sigma-70 factor (ECF subfamily)
VVFAFTVADGRVVRVDLLADPDTLAGVDLQPL